MTIHIKIETPEWDKHPEKSTMNNSSWRKVVQVTFEGAEFYKTGKEFVWIPTYDDLLTIFKSMNEAERMNKEKAKELFKQ